MASDAFIKTGGVSGEALAYKHKTWIEIDGYHFGNHQSTTATASSAGGNLAGGWDRIGNNQYA
nr:type VI secretion system tube protein Hcp [uncultured Pseudomonas sp.]